MSISKSSSSSTSTPQVMMQKDLKAPRNALSNLVTDIIRKGGASNFTNPQGPVGDAYKNLLSTDMSQDFLGAKGRLSSILSGSAMGDAQEQAFKFMLPQLDLARDKMRTGVLDSNASVGNRFSSDVLDQTRLGERELFADASSRAGELGLGMFNTQANAALNTLGQVLGVGQADLDRLMPLIMNWSSQFAPIGNTSSGKDNSFGAGFNFTLNR